MFWLERLKTIKLFLLKFGIHKHNKSYFNNYKEIKKNNSDLNYLIDCISNDSKYILNLYFNCKTAK